VKCTDTNTKCSMFQMRKREMCNKYTHIPTVANIPGNITVRPSQQVLNCPLYNCEKETYTKSMTIYGSIVPAASI